MKQKAVTERVGRLSVQGWFTAVATATLFALAVNAQPTGRQVLRVHMPAAVARLSPLGNLPGTNRLNLAIGLPLRNQGELNQLLRELYDPGSPKYHQYLTPAEFTERFGPTAQDYQAVIAFAQANGLRVSGTHPNRVLVDVNGSVADIERALHVRLREYRHPTEQRTFYAPNVAPSLDLTVPVLSINGLDDYSLPRPRLQATLLANPPNGVQNAGSGPGGGYMGKDFRAAYVPDTTLNGAGQVVGLLQFDGYTASDITYYESLAGLPSITLSNVLIDGASGAPSGSGGEVEVSLDIEMAISMATNLSKVVVYMAPNPSPFVDLLSRMANDNVAKQLSCSWYVPNGGAEPAADQIWQQMAAQGQSFYNASGDYDAYTGLIDFPGDTPYITQVGGTTLTTSGPQGTWGSETVWNRGNGIGSGGGISTQYGIPSWQTNISMVANGGSTTKRNVPDVALTAENVYVRANGRNYTVGGTSCAAPLWAGFGALVNQQAAATGKASIGFINPLVDGIGTGANYTSAFHDITTGNNTSPSSPNRFYAVSGYDLCTGWGTPAGQKLINALANPEALIITPASGFSSLGGVGGPFTVTTQSLTLTNVGTNALMWTLVKTSLWLNATPSGGTLTVGGPAATVTVSLNTAASNLVVGTYSATLWFTNLNSGIGQSRQYNLSVISPPTIVQQPTNEAVLEGATATFTVSVSGGQPMTYLWRDNGTNLVDGGNIGGSTTTNLTINNVSPTDLGTYSLVASNVAGVAISSNASLTITPSQPVIIGQPADQTAAVGGTVIFAVAAIGTTPFFYQWRFNGTNIDAATNASLTLANLQFSDAGSYSVIVSNTYGATNSDSAVLMVFPGPISLFFDDFNGPTLNPIWQGGLPNAYSGSFPYGSSQIATYIGTPSYGFQMLGTNTVLRMTNIMNTLQRCGWSSTTNFASINFHYEARFNTLIQSPSNSIDGFIEIWIMDAANSNRYDIVSPFSGGYASNPSFFSGSSIDSSYTETPYPYQNNTWYRLVLECIPGQNIRAALRDDNGVELIGRTFNHDVSAYSSGFKIVLSQVVGYAGGLYPVDVAVDYVKLTTGFAPTVVMQPTNEVIAVGGTANFSVTAIGTVPLSYQWNFNGTNILGATNASLTLTNLQMTDSGNYAVWISNAYGSLLSSNATLTVGLAPTIFAQPTNQTIAAGSPAILSVTAGGSQPLSYQWQFNGVNLSGATNTSLSLTNVQFNQGGNYAVLVTNVFGSILSSNAALTVLAPPFITTQPTNQSVAVGGVAMFTATASGTLPLVYQWSFNTTNIPGATNTSMTLTNVQLTQTGSYTLLVSNAYGSILSSNALLTVYPVSPFITTQPANQTVAVGGTATFTVGASGTPPLSYHWKFNGTNILGATNAVLTLANVQFSQAGSYAVLVSSPYGSTNSVSAVLAVVAPPAIYFFDDFNGPTLNPIWQASLPNAPIPFLGSSGNATYLGAPTYSFQTLGGYSVLRMSEKMSDRQRVGWSSSTNFNPSAFTYEVRFNTLTQSISNSIDDFIEVWILDSANTNRYDIVALFGAGYATNPKFTVGSSIDNTYSTQAYNYGNNTWYRLVIQDLPGQNIRLSLDDDSGTELIGQTLNHSKSTYSSGFKIALSQGLGLPQGTYPSDVAVDYVKLTPSVPAITVQPTNQAAAVGGAANFSVTAVGTLPLSYQWSFDGTNILGATNASLTLTDVKITDAGNYTVLVTNLYGSVMSSNAALAVGLPPTNVSQLVSVAVAVGCDATFNVSAEGDEPLNYQWVFNGTNIVGATNASLTLTDIQTSDFGSYQAVVANLFGSVTSSPALLTLGHPPVAGADTIYRFAAGGVRVNASVLLANDTDADGDSLSIIEVSSSSSAGGTVGLTNNWIYYAPPTNDVVFDTFAYVVSDGHCGSDIGVVTVQVRPDNPQPVTFAVANPGDGTVRLTFDGIPGYAYRLEYTEDLSNPNWQTLTAQTADGFGVCRFVDGSLTNTPMRFYRAVWP